jgi:hypothetical protein
MEKFLNWYCWEYAATPGMSNRSRVKDLTIRIKTSMGYMILHNFIYVHREFL